MSNKLLEKILKNSPTKYTSILSESEFFKDKDVIQTDLPILNVAFSGDIDGGISSGLTTISGESKSFKTLLALFCVKAYLKKYDDAICILYDSEGGTTPDYVEAMGIDTSRVVHVPIDHLEMLKFDMAKTLKELDRTDHVIMLVDSIGNTASLKELEDAENEKSVADMQRAKYLKGLFRIITPSLISKDVPCICIAHVYKTMEMFAKNVISGGSGILYSSNQAFIITKAQEKDGSELVGWKFTINIEKSRHVKEKSKLPFVVKYKGGISRWSGLLDLALESGHVTKPKMGWYAKVDQETKEIIGKNYREKETNTKDFWQDILDDVSFKTFVKDKYSLSASPIMQEETDEDIEQAYAIEDEE